MPVCDGHSDGMTLEEIQSIAKAQNVSVSLLNAQGEALGANRPDSPESSALRNGSCWRRDCWGCDVAFSATWRSNAASGRPARNGLRR